MPLGADAVGSPLFTATGADDGYARTLFDSRAADGRAPNVTSLARYAGRIGVLSTGDDPTSGTTVAECAIGFAARLPAAVDTAAYAVEAHLFDATADGGAPLGHARAQKRDGYFHMVVQTSTHS